MARRLSLVLLVYGCGACGTSAVTARGEAPADRVMMAKLAPYLDCLDEQSAAVFEIADAYRFRFATRPPTVEAKPQVAASPDPTKCLEALAGAKGDLPSLPELEAAGEGFAAAVREVAKVTRAAHYAYSGGAAGYVAKGLAAAVREFTEMERAAQDAHAAGAGGDIGGGIALHPRLLTAFAAFDRAQARLFDEVHRRYRVEQLARIEREEHQDGRTLKVAAERMMLQAGDVVAFSTTPADQLAGLDATALAAQLAEFERMSVAVRELDEAPSRYAGLAQPAAAFAIAGRQLAQRAQGQVAYTDSERIMIGAANEAGVVGTPAALIAAYNKLVATYLNL